MNGTPKFAAVSAGWCEEGLGISLEVTGKSIKPSGTSADISRSDCFQLWIDTRPVGNVHRATEYCHHFACLPADEHNDGKPGVTVQPIAQQRATRIESDPKKMKVRTHVTKGGYDFEIWIPASQLYGFREVSELGRIGFYCVVCDTELGEQPLSIGDDFPTAYDPSTWIQLELNS